MVYQVLALKWRPTGFEQVVAQEHVTRTLQNAITTNRIANAYLFAGPRGVGKTTTARILAKALNCKEGPTASPCDQCSNCREIAAGHSLDVLEIDGASNRGIDEIRNLQESIRYLPSSAKFKLIIVDEVHMLTEPAFNALLKTLEEPPPHVRFIFATTEPYKVPATILSRCQRFDFKRIPVDRIISQLRLICEKESVQIDEASLLIIAKKADGSMRDCESLLDQLISFCGTEIKVDDVLTAFSVVSQDLYFELTDILNARNLQQGLQFVDHLLGAGYDINEFLLGLSEHLRNFLFVQATRNTKLLETAENYKQRYLSDAGKFSQDDLLRMVQIISETETTIKRSANPRIKLEMCVLKLTKMDRSVTFTEVISQLAEMRTIGSSASGHTLAVRENQEPTLFTTAKNSPTPLVLPDLESQKKTAVSPPNGEADPTVAAIPGTAATNNGEPAPLSLAVLQERWHEFLNGLSKKHLYLSILLKLGEPVRFENDELEIGFAYENGFHLTEVQKEREVILQSIQEFLGATVRLKFTKTSQPQQKPQQTPPAESVPAPGAQKKMDPKVKRIMDIFNGELLNFGG